MKIATLTTRGRITLPKAIREANNWRPGTVFTVAETAEGVLFLVQEGPRKRRDRRKTASIFREC